MKVLIKSLTLGIISFLSMPCLGMHLHCHVPTLNYLAGRAVTLPVNRRLPQVVVDGRDGIAQTRTYTRNSVEDILYSINKGDITVDEALKLATLSKSCNIVESILDHMPTRTPEEQFAKANLVKCCHFGLSEKSTWPEVVAIVQPHSTSSGLSEELMDLIDKSPASGEISNNVSEFLNFASSNYNDFRGQLSMHRPAWNASFDFLRELLKQITNEGTFQQLDENKKIKTTNDIVEMLNDIDNSIVVRLSEDLRWTLPTEPAYRLRVNAVIGLPKEKQLYLLKQLVDGGQISLVKILYKHNPDLTSTMSKYRNLMDVNLNAPVRKLDLGFKLAGSALIVGVVGSLCYLARKV